MYISVPLINKKFSQKIHLIIGVLGFFCILLIALLHHKPPFFDEVFFVKNFELFEKHGLSKEFLLQMDKQAPGPLYQLIHFAFKPLTHLQTPGIRLVNVFLLALTILVMAKIITLIKKILFVESLVLAIALVAVPMVWQVAGLALTEIPSMFFSMLSVLLLFFAMKWEEAALKSSAAAIAAGLSLGLAILGRSPFLLLAFSPAVLLLNNFSSAKRWRTILFCGICALSISIPVFVIWGGLVPPQQAFVEKGFSIWHGVLAFAYAAFLTLIIAPKWFYFNKKTILYFAICYVILLLINIFIISYRYVPLDGIIGRFSPEWFIKVYPLIISPFLATLSFYFIYSSILQAWKKRNDAVFLFIFISAILLLASSFKVTHLFSTRYVAQAAPFFIILFAGYDKLTISRLIRFIIGMAIGFMSLETYFNFM